MAASTLTSSLVNIGFEIGRLKTGTPPRLVRRTIDFARTEAQPGEEPVPYFSCWLDDLFHVEQRPPQGAHQRHTQYPPGSILATVGQQQLCHITYTTPKTGQIVRSNLDRSPLYGGVIKGVGPRYCPSIEDKIMKFADKERHQIFLEPEGAHTEEVYVNGLSTSLPFDVQLELVRSVVGCERAEMTRPAYAVEYDFVPPTQLQATLESKPCRNLFLAGQINGTSGYEEAAAQGIIAGINAARRVRGQELLVLRRDQAYIGVLIDDLVTKGTNEPYRMFTSRAEYRLFLRQDNADERLAPIGHSVGLLPTHKYQIVLRKQESVAMELARLRSTKVGSLTLEQMLRRPELSYRDLPGSDPNLPDAVVRQVEVTAKYAGYMERQELEIERLRKMEAEVIPESLDYTAVVGLKMESRHKLNAVRPKTLGQASRISGVSPSDLGVIMVHLHRKTRGTESRVTAKTLEAAEEDG